MKSNLKVLIRMGSNWKSNFLANLNINKKVIYPFCFCIRHNSIIQIYFFKEIIDDFDIYWNILYKDSLYWYWNVNFYINLQIEEYLLVFSWNLKTIRYPNN